MRYFVPQLKSQSNFDSQDTVKEKLGGLPFGLPTEIYPICKKCKSPMSLLAQFVHDAKRLNLGKDGRALFVFQCNNQGFIFSTCTVWDADSGANTCFILESESMTGQIEKLPDGQIDLNKEFWIIDWKEMNDGILEDEAVYFFGGDAYEDLDDEMAEELFDKVVDVTKLGSVPSWIQYPEIPEGNWRFVGQLDDKTGFNFGDAGIGYIFIEEVENIEQLPKGKFLWQCG